MATCALSALTNPRLRLCCQRMTGALLNDLGATRLQELIANLEQLDDDYIICVMKPWSPEASARLTLPNENEAVPDELKLCGFSYFLEVHVAKEVLEVFGAKPPSVDEKVRLLIEYAENDAYPAWVYDRER